MFNIHSTELLLVCIVALIVIGPDKLPGAIKTASLWIGRFRRSFYKVKAEIERELNADEIRRQLHNEAVLADIEEAKNDVKGLADSARNSISSLSDIDPGAARSSYLESQAVAGKDIEDETSNTEADAGQTGSEAEEKTVVGEISEATEQIKDAKAHIDKEVADIKRDLYGSGRNPKLAQPSAGQSDQSQSRDSGFDSDKS